MGNPYRAPGIDTPKAPSARSAWRLLGWAVLLYIAVNMVAFLWGLSIGHWEIFGDTLEEAFANHRLGMRVVVWLTATALYFKVALDAGPWLLREVGVVLAFVLVIDAMLELLVFNAQFVELADPGSLARSISAAVGGLMVARMMSALRDRSRRSSLSPP